MRFVVRRRLGCPVSFVWKWLVFVVAVVLSLAIATAEIDPKFEISQWIVVVVAGVFWDWAKLIA